MSIYKAHKPILEIRTSALDWYNNRLWLTLDKRSQKSVMGYHSKKYQPLLIHNLSNGVVLRNLIDEYAVAVDKETACTDADLLRMKLTCKRQKCKIFMVYRRPTLVLT